jgi:dimethylargininase
MEQFTYAVTRSPGADFAEGLTHARLGTPDYKLMIRQHKDYVDTLGTLGLKIIELEPLPGYPDAYFVEDSAIATPDVAVITRPGARSRRGEERVIEPVLAQYRRIERILAPGTVDGGDVLAVDGHFFIGISNRTNKNGAGQLGRILEKYGNTWSPVRVRAGLHLKSSVNLVGDNTLLITGEFADLPVFDGYDKILLDHGEEYAGNTLLINGTGIMPAGFPKTKEKLRATGLEIIELDVSEARKMDGGLTCMSLRF